MVAVARTFRREWRLRDLPRKRARRPCSCSTATAPRSIGRAIPSGPTRTSRRSRRSSPAASPLSKTAICSRRTNPTATRRSTGIGSRSAAAGRIAGVIDRRFRAGGASTLATQTEKFRHSPAGRTPGGIEKLRQMVTASAHAYLDGPNTEVARRRIMTAYLNSEPLGRVRAMARSSASRGDVALVRHRSGRS